MAMTVVRQARLELSGGSTPDLLRPSTDRKMVVRSNGFCGGDFVLRI